MATQKLHEQVKQDFTHLILLAEAMRRKAEERNGPARVDRDFAGNKINRIEFTHDNTEISGFLNENAFNSKSPHNVESLFNENEEIYRSSFPRGAQMYLFGAKMKQEKLNNHTCYVPFSFLHTKEDYPYQDSWGHRLTGHSRKDIDDMDILRNGPKTEDDNKDLQVIINRLSRLHAQFREVEKGKKFEIPSKLTIDQFMR